MTPKILHAVGTALFGPRWQSDLARAVDVSERTMRRWAAGDVEMPEGLRTDILVLIYRRLAELQNIADRL